MSSRAVMTELALSSDDDDDDDDLGAMMLLAQASGRPPHPPTAGNRKTAASAARASPRQSLLDNAAAFFDMSEDDEDELTLNASESHVGDVVVPKLPLRAPRSAGSTPASPRAGRGNLGSLAKFADDDDEDWSEFDQVALPGSKDASTGVLGRAGGRSGGGGSRGGDEDKDEDKVEDEDDAAPTTLRLTPDTDDMSGFDAAGDALKQDRMRQALQRRKDDQRQADAAAETDTLLQGAMFEDHEFERDTARDLQSRQQKTAMALAKGLAAAAATAASIQEACDELVVLLREAPSLRRHIVTHHGVLPMLDVLSAVNAAPDGGDAMTPYAAPVVVGVLRVVNQIVDSDISLQESLSLIGVLPAVVKFSSPWFPTSVRMQASRFVEQLCTSSQITLQMFVACDGVQVLVNLLQSSKELAQAPPASAPRIALQQQEQFLLRTALAGIISVFHLKRVTKNEFYRLFMRVGLLPPLARALREAFLFLCGLFRGEVSSVSSPPSADPPPSGRTSHWGALCDRPRSWLSSCSVHSLLCCAVLCRADADAAASSSAPASRAGMLFLPTSARPPQDSDETTDSDDSGGDDTWMLDFKSNLRMPSDGRPHSLPATKHRHHHNHSHNHHHTHHPRHEEFRDRPNDAAPPSAAPSVPHGMMPPLPPPSRPAGDPTQLRASTPSAAAVTTTAATATATSAATTRTTSVSLPVTAHVQMLEESGQTLALQAMEACGSIVEILLLFSQGDAEVKQRMSIHEIITRKLCAALRRCAATVLRLILVWRCAWLCGCCAALLRMLRPAPLSLLAHPTYAPTVVRVLKTIKHVAMDPAGLAVLGEAGAVHTLVPFLVAEGRQVVPPEYHHSSSSFAGAGHTLSGASSVAISSAGARGDSRASDSPMPPAAAGHWAMNMATMATNAVESAQLAKDVQNHVVHALFYLCRVNKVNQQDAARAGIIPPLQKIVKGKGALKQLALSILCDLAFTNSVVRELLWDMDGVAFYVGLLGEPYWQITALNALSFWCVVGLLVDLT